MGHCRILSLASECYFHICNRLRGLLSNGSWHQWSNLNTRRRSLCFRHHKFRLDQQLRLHICNRLRGLLSNGSWPRLSSSCNHHLLFCSHHHTFLFEVPLLLVIRHRIWIYTLHLIWVSQLEQHRSALGYIYFCNGWNFGQSNRTGPRIRDINNLSK